MRYGLCDTEIVYNVYVLYQVFEPDDDLSMVEIRRLNNINLGVLTDYIIIIINSYTLVSIKIKTFAS